MRRIVRKEASAGRCLLFLTLDCGHTIVQNCSAVTDRALTAYCPRCASEQQEVY